jgi:hypothetical protein
MQSTVQTRKCHDRDTIYRACKARLLEWQNGAQELDCSGLHALAVHRQTCFGRGTGLSNGNLETFLLAAAEELGDGLSRQSIAGGWQLRGYSVRRPRRANKMNEVGWASARNTRERRAVVPAASIICCLFRVSTLTKYRSREYLLY